MLLLGLYLLTFSGRVHSIDELAALATVESVAREHTLRVPQLRWALGWTPTHVAEGIDGALYSKRGLGYSLAFWLPWQVAQFLPAPGAIQLAAFTNVLVTLGIAALLMRLLVELGVTEQRAAAIGLVYGLATPAWPYARYLFSEPLTALFAATALWLVLSPRTEFGRWTPVLCGLVAGSAVLVHAMNALVVFLFGAWWAWKGGKRHTPVPLIGFLAGLVPAALLLAGLNWARYGHPLTAGYTAPEERFVWSYAQSLPGLLVSPGKGVIWFVPAVVPSLVAWRTLWNRRPDVAVLLGAWAVGFLFLVGGWFMWWGGWSWGTRYWVALLPVLLLPLGWTGRWYPRAERWLLVGAAVAGFVVNALGVAADFNAPLVNLVQRGLPDTTIIWQWAYWPPLLHWRLIRQGHPDLVWWQDGVDLAVVSGIVLMVLVGLVVVQEARPWRGGACFGLLTLMVAVSVWGLTRHPWHATDLTAAEANAVILQEAKPNDVVLLELVPYYDYFTTVQSWMNRYKAPLPYRTVVRGEEVPPDVRALSRGRLWLVTERTPPGDPAAQVEQQLLGHMALLDDRWVEEWRLVRFVPVPADLTLDQQYTFSGGIELQAGVAQVEDLVVVWAQWQAHGPLDEPLNVFVQLLDEQGRLLAQHNRPPQNGQRPTPTWQPGEPVWDAYALPLHVPATLVVGLYDPLTGSRVPLADGSGEYAVLGTFR